MLESTYRLIEGVQWAVEHNGVLVIRHESGCTHHFGYPKAAVWDLLMRGYQRERLVRMLAAITAMNESHAAKLLQESLAAWCEQGLLAVEPHD